MGSFVIVAIENVHAAIGQIAPRNLYLLPAWTESSGRQLGLHRDPLSDPTARPLTPGGTFGAPR